MNDFSPRRQPVSAVMPCKHDPRRLGDRVGLLLGGEPFPSASPASCAEERSSPRRTRRALCCNGGLAGQSLCRRWRCGRTSCSRVAMGCPTRWLTSSESTTSPSATGGPCRAPPGRKDFRPYQRLSLHGRITRRRYGKDLRSIQARRVGGFAREVRAAESLVTPSPA
jgi:hypothetical protein